MPEGCLDTPVGWLDRDSDSCTAYALSGWCTLSGSTGDHWEDGWGPITDYAAGGHTAFDACCVCGGGVSRLGGDPTIDLEDPREKDLKDSQVPLLGAAALSVLLGGVCIGVVVWRVAPSRAHSRLQEVEEDAGAGSMPPQIVGSAAGEAGPEIFQIGDEDEGFEFVHDVEVGRHGESPREGSLDADEPSRGCSTDVRHGSGHSPPVFGGGPVE